MSSISHNHSSHNECPLNQFCSGEARTDCLNITLKSCQHCNVSVVHGLSVVYFILGIAIFLGNFVIISVYSYKYFKKASILKSDPIRLSLAVADIFTSIQIFAIVLPDLLQSINFTASQQIDFARDHSSAWTCGIVIVFCFSATLYHLILFGCQRLFAISNPMRYRRQTIKSVYIALAVVWTAAIFTASVPGILPRYFYYCRRSNLCFICSKSLQAYVIFYVMFLFIPFLSMTLISVITAIAAYKKLGGSNMIRQSSRVSQKGQKAFAMQQVSAFKTVAIMQIGFTLCVGPSLVGVILANFGLDCRHLDLYEIVCFVFFFANSIVNVVVYSVRDEKFRDTAVHLIRNIKSSKRTITARSELGPRTIPGSPSRLDPDAATKSSTLSTKFSFNSGIQRSTSGASTIRT